MHDCDLDPVLGGKNTIKVMIEAEAKAKGTEYYKLHIIFLKPRQNM